MRFKSFFRAAAEKWFGARQRSDRKGYRRPVRAFSPVVEGLETRVLLATTPTILSSVAIANGTTFSPLNGSRVLGTTPTLQITYSEAMDPTSATNASNYLLIGQSGASIPLAGPLHIDASDKVVTITPDEYNQGQPLPADTYTLFVKGYNLFEIADATHLPLSPQGQLVVGNGGQGNVDTVTTSNPPFPGVLSSVAQYGLAGVGSSPYGVVTADFNGDGLPDIAVSDSATNSVDIFFGEPFATGGGFNPTPVVVALPAGATNPTYLVTADFNRDGRPDLAVLNTVTTNVTVLLNRGGGLTFSGANYAVGVAPRGLVTGSFQGNGYQDLATVDNVLDSSSNFDVSVLQNSANGTGTFGAFQTYNVGNFTASTGVFLGLRSPAALTTVPSNGGPGPDLVIGGFNGMYVLTNASNSSGHPGDFFVVPNYSDTNKPIISPFGDPFVTYLTTGNLGDGATDLVALDNGGGSHEIEILTPNSSFDPNNPYVDALRIGDSNQDSASQVVVAKLNGASSPPDLLVTDHLGNALDVFRNTTSGGTLSFTHTGADHYIVDGRPVGVAVYRNADGNLDAVTGNNLAGDVTVLLGNGNHTFQFATQLSNTGAGPIAMADLNGDGVPDIVSVSNAATPNSTRVTILLSRPTGGYSVQSINGVNPTTAKDSMEDVVGVAIGALTAGGLPAIFTLDRTDGIVGILKNNGSNTFAWTPHAVVVGTAPTSLAVGYFNPNDPSGINNLDLAVSDNTGGSLSTAGLTVQIGDGTGNFTPVSAPTTAQYLFGANVTQVVTANVTNDSTPTLIAVTATAGQSYVHEFLGNNGGLFRDLNPEGFGAGIRNITSVSTGDINGDGFQDLVLTSSSTDATKVPIAIMINEAGLGFHTINPFPHGNPFPQMGMQSAAVMDLNQDGIPDLVVASDGDQNGGGGVLNNVYVLLGQRAPNLFTFLEPPPPAHPYMAGIPPIGGDVSPSYVAPLSQPLGTIASFTIVSNTQNIANNSSFTGTDLAGEQGNLDGWQSFKLPDVQAGSHGAWLPQTGSTSPLSATSVTPPPNNGYQAMLDEANLPGSNLDPTLYNQSSALYQDVFIPIGATSLSVSMHLFIDNTMAGQFTSTRNNPPLDYRTTAANQQVRVDLVDPALEQSILDTTNGILNNIFITLPSLSAVSPLNLNVSSGTLDLTSGPLAAYVGKTIRLRIGTTNNLGQLIVGVNSVKVNATVPSVSIPPTITGVAMRNPGTTNAPNSAIPHTTDPTIIGQVQDNYGLSNLQYILVDPTNQNFANSHVLLKILPAQVDAMGHFMVTVPYPVAGLNTVQIKVVDNAGNVSTTASITFYYQAANIDQWGAAGPQTIDTSGQPVNYNTVSGQVTSTIADLGDPTGNTLLVGSVSGGIWKSTDGGANYTPLTDLIFDASGNPVPGVIGAMAQSKSSPNVIYAGLGVASLHFDAITGNGILKSTNDGQTWAVIGNSETVFAGARISAMVVDNDSPQIVYAGVASGGQFGPGVYRSTDGGLTWTNVMTIGVMRKSDNTFFAAGTTLASVTSLIEDPFNSERLLVGLGNMGLTGATVTAGVWRTVNKGLTWDQIVGGDAPGVPNNTLPTGLGVGRVTLAMGTGRVGDEKYVYVLIGSPPGNNTAPNVDFGTFVGPVAGLYRTKDNLLNFTKVMLRQEITLFPPQFPTPGNPFNFVDINLLGKDASNAGALVVDPTNPNAVFVGGSTLWDPANFTDPTRLLNDHSLIRVDTSNMLDTTTVAADGTLPNNGDDATKFSSVVRFDSPTILTAPFYYDPTTTKWKYTGEGVSWYDLSQAVSTGVGSNTLLPPEITNLTIDSKGRLLIGTDQGLWRALSFGYGYDTTSNGTGIVAVTTQGLLPFGRNQPFTPAGATLTDLNGNLQISNLTSTAIDPVSPGVLYTTQALSGAAGPNSLLPGSPVLNWVSEGLTGPSFLNIPTASSVQAAYPSPTATPGSPVTLYRYWQFADPRALSTVEVSFDNGTTWNSTERAGINQSNNPAPMFPGFSVNPVSILDSGIFENIIQVGTNRDYLTRTTSNVWDPLSGPLSSKGGLVTAVTYSPSQINVFYAGTNLGEVFYTVNNGADGFPERDAGLPSAPVNSIYVDPVNSSVVWAMFGGSNIAGHLWKSNDAGLTWSNVSFNLPNVPITSMVVDLSPSIKAPAGREYVATTQGVYVTNDGTNWIRLNSSMPNVPVSNLTFNAGEHTLAAATSGRGVFDINTANISTVPDQTIQSNTSTGPIPFTISDPGLPAGSYQIAAFSSNQTLVPNANIILGGQGANRTIQVTPAPGQAGVCTITIAVGDGLNAFYQTFTLDVVGSIPNQTIPENSSSTPVVFTVGDLSMPATPVSLSVSTDNATLLPKGSIVFSGTGNTRTMIITPAAGQTGTSVVTVTVTDSANISYTITFGVRVPTAETLPFRDFDSTTTAVKDNPFMGTGWNEVVGDISRHANQADSNGALNVAIVNGITAATNTSVQANVTVGLNQAAGLISRYTGTNGTFTGDTNMYFGAVAGLGGNSYVAFIYSNVNGTWSQLASQAFTSASTAQTLRFDTVGSSLKLFVNGTLDAYANDTSLTSGDVGVRTTASTVLDTFSASAITTTNGSLPFTDNFSSPTFGGQLAYTWQDQAGDYTLQNNQALSAGALDLATVNGINQANVSVSADVTVGANQAVGLVTRYTGIAGAGDANMYYGALVGLGSNTYEGFIYKNVGGTWTFLASGQVISNPTTPLFLRFDNVGPALKLFLNGSLVAFANDTSLTSGTIGMRSTAGATVGDSTAAGSFQANAVNITNGSLPFTDNFGSPTYGSQLSLNWLDQVGDYTLQSNQAVAEGAVSLATVNGISQDNVSVSADVTVGNGQAVGLVTRYSGIGDTNMYYGALVGMGSNNYQGFIYKNVGGTWTFLASGPVINSPATPLFLRFDNVGSSLKLFLDGSLIAYADDSSLTSGTVGMRSTAGATVGDSTAAGSFQAKAVTVTNPGLPFTDSFGSPGYGSQLSLSWLDQAGDYTLQSNQAVAKGALSLATVNGINQANVSVSADVSVGNGQAVGLVTRYSGIGDTNMYFGALVGMGSNNYQGFIYKNVNGTWTFLGSSSIVSNPAAPLLLRFDTVGSSQKLFLNGSLLAYANDTSLTTGSVGMRSTAGAAVGDGTAGGSFQATAVTVSSTASPPFSDSFTTPGYGSQLSLSWQDQVGNYTIQSAPTPAEAVAKGPLDVSTVNGLTTTTNESVQADVIVSMGVSAGLVARYSGSGDTNMYFAALTQIGSSSFDASIWKNVNGLWTELTHQSVSSSGSGNLKFVVKASTLTLFLDNVQVALTSDTDLTSGTVGMRSTAGAELTNFSVVTPP